MSKWNKILTTPQLTPYSPDLYTCDKNVFDGLKESLTGIGFEDLNSFSTISEYKTQVSNKSLFLDKIFGTTVSLQYNYTLDLYPGSLQNAI